MSVLKCNSEISIKDFQSTTPLGYLVRSNVFGLFDANGNEVIKWASTASAVNEITLTNTATGTSPAISATGGDTNLGLRLILKGTGALSIYSDSTRIAYSSTAKGLYIDPTSVTEAINVGANANAVGSGVVLARSGNTASVRFYADDNGAALNGSGSVPDIRGALSRFLLTANHSAGHVRLHGAYNMLASYNGYWNTEVAAGSTGVVQIVNTAAKTFGGYGLSAGVLGQIATGASSDITVDTNHTFAGVAAISDLKGTVTQTGKTVGMYVGIYDTTNWSDGTSRAKWKYGIYVKGNSCTEGLSIGEFASSYATGSGVPFSSSGTTIARVYGESTSDLTSAKNCRVLLGRHLVVTASGTVNQETYGTYGQVCVKNTTLAHLHAGIMGTVEVSTAATFNSAYAYGVAGVMARVGTGTAITTATKPVCGVASVWNAGALVSGDSIAFAACSTTATNWTYLLAADHCDNLFYAATGVAYEHGVKLATVTPGATGSVAVRFQVGATPFYFVGYAAGDIEGE